MEPEIAAALHTPGPWELHQKIGDRNSVHVCVPDTTTERRCRSVAEAEILGMPRLEAEANARLIAAAPELLAACQRMLACHQAAVDAAHSNASVLLTYVCDCGACDEARAAVAKAERPPTVDAVDPHAASTGTPSTREKESSSLSSSSLSEEDGISGR